jgi:hypothetical protein
MEVNSRPPQKLNAYETARSVSVHRAETSNQHLIQGGRGAEENRLERLPMKDVSELWECIKVNVLPYGCATGAGLSAPLLEHSNGANQETVRQQNYLEVQTQEQHISAQTKAKLAWPNLLC